MYAHIAQLGERQIEDLKVSGSIPGLGMHFRLLFNPQKLLGLTAQGVLESLAAVQHCLPGRVAEAEARLRHRPPCSQLQRTSSLRPALAGAAISLNCTHLLILSH